MILKLGGSKTSLSSLDVFRVFPNVALDWEEGSNRTIQSAFSPLPAVVTPQLAGFFIKEFSLDGDGNTIPASILAGIFNRMKVRSYLVTDLAAPGSIVYRVSPFFMYNVFDPTTVTFADLESWVKNDTESNEKYNAFDLEWGTSTTSASEDLQSNGTGDGPFSFGTFDKDGNADVELSDITAVGLMCEVIAADNVKVENTPMRFAIEVNFQYIT